MTTTYSKISPYAQTPIDGFHLGLLAYRDFPKLKEDLELTINDVYEYRPHLLAYDLYGDSGLWWVFIVRNPDVLEDPISDFISGTIIRLPSKATLTKYIGF